MITSEQQIRLEACKLAGEFLKTVTATADFKREDVEGTPKIYLDMAEALSEFISKGNWDK